MKHNSSLVQPPGGIRSTGRLSTLSRLKSNPAASRRAANFDMISKRVMKELRNESDSIPPYSSINILSRLSNKYPAPRIRLNRSQSHDRRSTTLESYQPTSSRILRLRSIAPFGIKME